ncbi:Glycosyltransferase Gtf1 [bioreactor metagenome]|uniref:Glycosyltransferase Gtf1 n=1 Tax=bioreactor metagenome TaxID=1076179 RepID=A0A644ZJI1_9ZZZZ
MKLTFYSNFINHHQIPLCLEFYKALGDEFKFVVTEQVPEERLAMGYRDLSELYPFIVKAYLSESEYEYARLLGEESDVVIIGSAPEEFVRLRICRNKLTFRYSERVFKKGRWLVLYPVKLFKLLRNHTLYRSKNVYLLGASAYAASDFLLVGAYKNKAYTWGYFPEVKEYPIDVLMHKKNNDIPKILWVGRFIALKHPELMISLAKRLKENGFTFSLDLIGTGPLQAKLKKCISKYRLENEVTILGSMSPEEVRSHMEQANIFLFTSNYLEGWGAVLNEAMNSGCAVVASHAIGSVPVLLKNNENGLIYTYRNNQQMFDSVVSLLNNPDKCRRFGRKAYTTLVETWNPAKAAERFIVLASSLLNGKEVMYEDGPCSKAKLLTHAYGKTITRNNGT